MTRFDGEVIFTPDEASPYVAVVYGNDRIVSRTPVQSEEEGERLVAHLLKALEDFDATRFKE
jgi:hypothetical protein